MRRTQPPPTLFPYTTLFRSVLLGDLAPAVLGFLARLERTLHLGRAFHQLVEIHRAELAADHRSEEHTSEFQSRRDRVCRLLLEKKNRARRPPISFFHIPYSA